MATQQQIDDEILARAIAIQVAMVAESEMNGWELLRLFQLANAAKRTERQMRIAAQESNWEATKYIAAIGRVIANDRNPNQMETTPQVIQRIIKERDELKEALNIALVKQENK